MNLKVTYWSYKLLQYTNWGKVERHINIMSWIVNKPLRSSIWTKWAESKQVNRMNTDALKYVWKSKVNIKGILKRFAQMYIFFRHKIFENWHTMWSVRKT